ncbi:ATP-dependent DNA helicase RecG [Minwuia thermotolerans]|uniref:Probable DNA 3'-5' helicase RecG n=1 Tax=Minwuia thermotolerans TaxID=2056226 RepID=A0A2M9FW90_9PROT|nr:ATP-dependent DNA helicase RecG [Minwuia thermotolerans]PJK27730.1 ATP-dependent DNA helicase RecG [Minwuia thermotolerans]
MRPEILFALFQPATNLKGVGPRVAALLDRLGASRVLDLIWLLPSGVIDRGYRPKLEDAETGRVATIDVTVTEHRAGRGRQPYRVIVTDGTASAALVFFNPRRDWLEQTYPPGARRLISGRIDRYGDALQMAHPDYAVDPAAGEEIPAIEPVYPLTAGLAPKTLRHIVARAAAQAPDLPEWLDPALKERHGFPAWRDAVRSVHAPERATAIESTPALRRLAYDELLANQLALSLVRRRLKRRGGRRLQGDGRIAEKVRQGLRWELTGAQRRVLAEILEDMASPHRMMRLIQGDVGSGKTVVALLAAAAAVEAGTQAALMVPTEVLARQHARTLVDLAGDAGLRIACLTGRDKTQARRTILRDLNEGRIDLLVGTHALFQEGVDFHDLGLVIVDEQHRFGVHQRMLLSEKSERPADILVMTATPIPRTLAMTAYGDMDVSRIDERPPGRAAVDTRVVSAERLDDVIERLSAAMDRGDRAYWICPLVEETEDSELAAAEQRHRELRQRFGDRVGLVHGRMRAEDKDMALQRFADGDATLLVATTVVEVGVDVPEATIIVIEEADRFGLAQLHQLRGRVGRGDRPGVCLLIYRPPLGETARARLRTLRETDDGFRIAEEDYRLRGAGELLGTRQSGLPGMRLAAIDRDQDLMEIAHDDARLIVETDPELRKERGRALRILLYLFERDAAIRYLESG